MIPFTTIMIKPASSLCNLCCKYCFYADEASKRNVPNFGLMNEETMENIIVKTLEYTKYQLNIGFQGGEPTLRGLDFFKKFVECVNKHNTRHINVFYSLQTNGILLDESWCEFFAKNRFLIGISLDGNEIIHNSNRVDQNNQGTFTKVMESIKLLKQYGIDFNILTVLTHDVANNFKEIDKFYKEQELTFQQYIPCLDPLGEERGHNFYSLQVEDYEKFLKDSFDSWYNDLMEGHKSYNRFFDNLMLMFNRQPPESCAMNGVCGHMYIIEANGNTYPCDFYMLDEYLLGNFNTSTMEEMDNKRKEIKFIENSYNHDEDCRSCRWFPLCRGGCRRDRDYFDKGLGRNYYCEAYKRFFEYAYDRLEKAYYKLVNTPMLLND